MVQQPDVQHLGGAVVGETMGAGTVFTGRTDYQQPPSMHLWTLKM